MHPITETVTTESLLNIISDLVGDTIKPDSASIAAWHLLEKLGRRADPQAGTPPDISTTHTHDQHDQHHP